MPGPRVKLDIDATRDKLAGLGLSYAAEALDPLLAEAVQADMGSLSAYHCCRKYTRSIVSSGIGGRPPFGPTFG